MLVSLLYTSNVLWRQVRRPFFIYLKQYLHIKKNKKPKLQPSSYLWMGIIMIILFTHLHHPTRLGCANFFFLPVSCFLSTYISLKYVIMLACDMFYVIVIYKCTSSKVKWMSQWLMVKKILFYNSNVWPKLVCISIISNMYKILSLLINQPAQWHSLNLGAKHLSS